MPSPLARTRIALDPGRVVRPRATPDHDQPDAVRDWLAHLDAGRLIPAPRALVDPTVEPPTSATATRHPEKSAPPV